MKVLFATDGSPAAMHALREARRILPLANAEVHVISVVNPFLAVPAFDPAAAAGSTMLVDRLEHIVRDELKSAQALLVSLGVQSISHERLGDPAVAILALARELEVDVIVLGSHGANAVERFFVGSVCDRVTHEWEGATLVVRPEPGAGR